MTRIRPDPDQRHCVSDSISFEKNVKKKITNFPCEDCLMISTPGWDLGIDIWLETPFQSDFQKCSFTFRTGTVGIGTVLQ